MVFALCPACGKPGEPLNGSMTCVTFNCRVLSYLSSDIQETFDA